MTDTWMIILFPFLDFIPYALPRYWLFRDKLRIPFPYMVLLIFLISACNSGTFYCINQGGHESAAQWTTIMRYGFMLVNLACSFLLIKERFPQLMFTYLILMSWSFFVFGNANYIESRFFWDLSEQHPYLVYNIARVFIYLITCPILFKFLYHMVADALKIQDEKMWRHLWKIPLFSVLFGMLYCFTDDVYAYATWQFIISRYFMLLGSCYVSYVALKVLEISRGRMQLEEALTYADRNLLAQKKQYDSLAAHMDEMRRARHDLRQHIAVIQSYIERDDRGGLAEYIDIYKNELPPDTPEIYCRNDVVNSIVCYYAVLARENKIRFEAKLDYPKRCPVSATDITVLLGNLLENAVEACKREAGEQKYIKLRVKLRRESALLILVDNTSAFPVIFEGNTPLSAKRGGAGIGVSSVREIAARYGGAAQFEQRDGVFYASVSLQFTPM